MNTALADYLQAKQDADNAEGWREKARLMGRVVHLWGGLSCDDRKRAAADDIGSDRNGLLRDSSQ